MMSSSKVTNRTWVSFTWSFFFFLVFVWGEVLMWSLFFWGPVWCGVCFYWGTVWCGVCFYCGTVWCGVFFGGPVWCGVCFYWGTVWCGVFFWGPSLIWSLFFGCPVWCGVCFLVPSLMWSFFWVPSLLWSLFFGCPVWCGVFFLGAQFAVQFFLGAQFAVQFFLGAQFDVEFVFYWAAVWCRVCVLEGSSLGVPSLWLNWDSGTRNQVSHTDFVHNRKSTAIYDWRWNTACLPACLPACLTHSLTHSLTQPCMKETRLYVAKPKWKSVASRERNLGRRITLNQIDECGLAHFPGAADVRWWSWWCLLLFTAASYTHTQYI